MDDLAVWAVGDRREWWTCVLISLGDGSASSLVSWPALKRLSTRGTQSCGLRRSAAGKRGPRHPLVDLPGALVLAHHQASAHGDGRHGGDDVRVLFRRGDGMVITVADALEGDRADERARGCA